MGHESGPATPFMRASKHRSEKSKTKAAFILNYLIDHFRPTKQHISRLGGLVS